MVKKLLTPSIIKQRKKFENQKKNLICRFDKDALLEIKLPKGGWVQVTYMAFRSWGGGERRIDSIPYIDSVYLYGTNQTQ